MMKKLEIKTSKAPKALGPYSQAVKVGNFLFLSGQIPVNPIKNKVADGNITLQTRQALNNIKTVLKKAGSSLNKVVKANIYLSNMDDFNDFNVEYATFFKKPYPARICVEVSRLPKDVLCEIDVIAIVK